MTRAEDPQTSTDFGFGADAMWGLYLRIGSPLSTDRIMALDLREFREGMLAAGEVIRSQHDQNLAVTLQENKELRARYKEQLDMNAKLRAELKGRNGGGRRNG